MTNKPTLTIIVVAPGHSIHTRRFIEALFLHNNKVVAVCEKNPIPEGHDGYRFMRMHYGPPGYSLIHALFDNLLGYKTVEQLVIKLCGLFLKWQCRRIKPDVVHLLWLDKRANVCLASGLKPLVLNCWGSDINRHFLPNADPLEREFCKQALSDADMVICDTPDMLEKCDEIAGTRLKSALIHLGVDTGKFAAKLDNGQQKWREKLHIPMDALVLTSMRAWYPMYGHHLILEAFAGAAKRISKKVFLVFKRYNKENYPNNQDYDGHVRTMARKLEISEKIRWLDTVPYEQLPKIYYMSDIIINYPERDTLGITLIEAAFCEKFIISCELPSYKGTFVEKYAKLVPLGDLKKLEDAIVEVANMSYEELEPGLKAARCEAEENYSYLTFAKRLKMINEELSSGCLKIDEDH